jgi:putative oxidoreductase
MLRETNVSLTRDKLSIMGRILMGFLFFGSGLSMLFIQTPAGVGQFFLSLGLPFATLLPWPVIIFKIAAGGAVMAGKRVTLAASALIIFTLLTTVIAHRDISDPGLLKNLAVVGGLLYLVSFGPGGMNIKK